MQLILRTLNDAKTAFAAVELQRGVFFHEYGLEPASRSAAARNQGSQTEEEPFLGKVLLKVCPADLCPAPPPLTPCSLTVAWTGPAQCQEDEISLHP